MKRFILLGLACVLIVAMMPSASAATLSMEYSPASSWFAGSDVASGTLKVSSMYEDSTSYYFLLGSTEKYRDIAVARVLKSDGALSMYSIYSETELKGFMIDDFTVSVTGDIWLKLFGDTGRFAVLRDGTIDYIDIDIGDAVRYALGEGCGAWADGESIYVWDGRDTVRYEITAKSGSIVDIAVHNGFPAFILESGDVYVLGDDGWVVTSLSERMGIPRGSVGQGTLVSMGGTLWCSASIGYTAEDEPGSYRIAYSGLLPLSGNGHSAVALAGEADTIQNAMQNADGSLCFVMRKIGPVMPGSLPGDESLYYSVAVTKGSAGFSAKVDASLAQPERVYKDQSGSIWIFGTQTGVIITKPDDTSISYLPPGSLKRTNIVVLFNGNEIGFDSEPYIEGSRTMVPVRGIAYLLGADTTWNQVSKTVTFRRGDTTISLIIGEASAFVNDKEITLDAPAIIQNGRTMVPLRFVSEAFGAKVDWDNISRTVTIEW